MRKPLVISILCVLFTPMAFAQHLWIDASQFNKGDICVDIQAAIAALPIVPSTSTSSGIVIDARNFGPPQSGGVLSCSVNPFAIFNTSANPIVLVAQGTSSTPGNQGGVLLLPGFTIATDVPWFVPQSWSVIGQGGRVTFLVPSNAFTVPASPGTVSTSGLSNPVTLSVGSTWTSTVVGSVLFACPSGCTAGYQTATSVGIVTDFLSSNTLNLGTAVNLSSGSAYLFQTPLLAWATTVACPSTCTGALQSNTAGSVIQDIGLDCTKNGAGTSVPGCIPFWDEYGEERSQLKRIRITNFAGLGIGIFGVTAQNGGPFDDIQMVSGPGAITSATTCIEVGGTGLGASNQPTMRGIRGLTCVGPTNSPASVGTGVDINTQNFSLSEAHFEDFNVAVEVGSLTSSRGISVSEITGGGNAQSVNTVVDISSNCATNGGTNCQAFATADVNLQNIYQPSTNSGVVALKDNVSGSPRTTVEATLGFYSLGNGSGLGVASTRPVLTTSSSIGSSPNLVGMASGTPVTGVQGTTGTLVQMSSGSSFANGDLLQADSHSNTADSGIPVANIASTVTLFANVSGTSVSNALALTTIKLWGFSLTNAITTTAITYFVGTTDAVNNYSLGIYNSSGTLLVVVGPSTSLVNTANSKTASWTTGSGTTLPPGKYYFATATACTSSCATLGGAVTGSFAFAASGGTASGGALPATIPPPSDSWAVNSAPLFTLH